MPSNRSRERPGNRAKSSRRYLVLASVRLRPGREGEKRQRSKCEVESQENMQVDSAETVEETLHSRPLNIAKTGFSVSH
jgi:hypothetical protein